MKKLILIIALLVTAGPGYGDKNADLYQQSIKLYELSLNVIKKSLAVSTEEGYFAARDLASTCSSYIRGYIHGNLMNQNTEEKLSKRHNEWGQNSIELSNKAQHFQETNDWGQASYYAKKLFELDCKYSLTLKREFYNVNE